MLKEESRVSFSDSDHDEFDFDYNKQIHEELIMHEKIARLKVLEAIKSKPDIDFGLDDKIMDGILRYSMTQTLALTRKMDNKSVDLNHSIRGPLGPDTQTERILVQA